MEWTDSAWSKVHWNLEKLTMMVVFEVEHAGRCNINQLLISKVVPCWSLEAMKGAWRSDCYRSLLRDLKVVGPRGLPTESVTPGNGSPCRAPLAPSPRAQARPAAEGSPPNMPVSADEMEWEDPGMSPGRAPFCPTPRVYLPHRVWRDLGTL